MSRQLELLTIKHGMDQVLDEVDVSIVAAQVDVVMHSLGGLLVRSYADGPAFKRAANMGRGDFHKLLFLDTPHEGSLAANVATQLRSVIANPFNPTVLMLGVDKRVAALLGVNGLARSLGTKLEQFIGDALDDLRTDSAALAALKQLEVPTYAHVGNASAFLSPLTPDIYRALWMKDAPAAVYAWMATRFYTFDVIPDPSDLIVPVGSQEGGLASSHYQIISSLPQSIHTEVTSSQYAGNIAEEWVHRRPDDLTFFSPSIPAPVLTAAPSPAVTLADDYAAVPHFVGQSLKITVTNPPTGTTSFPGQVVRVAVSDMPRNDLGLGSQDTVFVFYPGGALVDKLQNLGNVAINVPLDYIGPFEIVAVGKRGDRRMVSSPHVLLNVDPGAKTPAATISSMRTDPTLLTLSARGATEEIRVIALYSDGYEREINGTAFGPTYSATGGKITITNMGIVVGVAAGSTTLHIAKGALSVDIPATVLNGTQINNAPHANAGESYSACDSQLVYLDGSGSYDVDQALGDVLAYNWDLDADGQFDDATGQTPFVTVLFPGPYWLIGLKVTDAAGLNSTDYAFLEAAPGCLDGTFTCSSLRTGASNAFVGTDAAGNVYVAEYDTGNSIPNRIVKLSPACVPLLTISLPSRPDGLVVSANGTIYLPQGYTVRKYASDGTSLGLITFSPAKSAQEIAVDVSGNIYGSGFENGVTAVVWKFSATGVLSKTWTVPAGFLGPVAVGPDESIYVVGQNQVAHGVLQSGNYVLDWTKSGAGVDPGLFDAITDLAVGPGGDLYVADMFNYRIQKFKSNGSFVRMWMGSGDPSGGGFYEPVSIAVGANEKLLVVDKHIPDSVVRVQVMGTNKSLVQAEITASASVQGVLYPHPATPVAACPKGDGDELVIGVALDPGTVVGPVPKSAFSVTMPADDDAVLYVAAQADADATLVNGKYRTTITLSKLGGCVSGNLVVKLNGTGIGAASVDLRSPDLITSPSVGSFGVVNFSDYAHFGTLYPPPYSSCVDYRAPFGPEVSLVDFAYFGTHYNHSTGGASLVAGEPQTSDATLRLELEETNPVAGSHRLWARLVLENAEPFTAMIVSLRSDHPMLEFVAWHQSPSYPEATLGTEVIRDGLNQVFLGIDGAGKPIGSIVELGKVEFDVQTDAPLILDNDDLAFVIADLLAVDGNVHTVSGLRFERTLTTPRYHNELGQNFPNPFNPATTIAFSVANRSNVTLSIFDVRGSLVRTLVDEPRDAGVHRVPWDGNDGRGSRAASGVYFYRLVAGQFRATKKMVLLR